MTRPPLEDGEITDNLAHIIENYELRIAQMDKMEDVTFQRIETPVSIENDARDDLLSQKLNIILTRLEGLEARMDALLNMFAPPSYVTTHTV